MKYMKWI